MKRLTRNKAWLWVAVILATLMLGAAGAMADQIIVTPVPDVIVNPDPVIVTPEPVIVTPPEPVIVNPRLEFMSPAQMAIPTPNGSVYVQAGTSGSVPTLDGGFVRYWTNSDGTTYYQTFDSSGHRSRRHRL